MRYFWTLPFLFIGTVEAATCTGPALSDAMYNGITGTSTKSQIDALVGANGVESVKYARFVDSAYDYGSLDSISYQWVGSNGTLTVSFNAAGLATNRSRELTSSTGTISNDAFGALGPSLSKSQIDTVLGLAGYEENSPLGSSEYASYRWGVDPYVSVGFVNGQFSFKNLSGKSLVLPTATSTLSEAVANGLSGKTLTAVESQLGKGQVTSASYNAGTLQSQGYSWKDSSGNTMNVYISYPDAVVTFALFTAANSTNKVASVSRSQYESIVFGTPDSGLSSLFGVTSLIPVNSVGGGYTFEDAAGNSVSAYSFNGQVYFRSASLVCGGGSGGAKSFSISGLSSGANSALKLSAAVNVADPDAGKPGSLWVIALIPPSTMFALTSAGWGPVTGATFPAYKAVTMGSHTINILDGSMDVSALVGVMFFVGYGKDQSDLVANLKFAKIHQIK